MFITIIFISLSLSLSLSLTLFHCPSFVSFAILNLRPFLCCLVIFSLISSSSPSSSSPPPPPPSSSSSSSSVLHKSPTFVLFFFFISMTSLPSCFIFFNSFYSTCFFLFILLLFSIFSLSSYSPPFCRPYAIPKLSLLNCCSLPNFLPPPDPFLSTLLFYGVFLVHFSLLFNSFFSCLLRLFSYLFAIRFNSATIFTFFFFFVMQFSFSLLISFLSFVPFFTA
ncbi:unnamed protein product [Acanthosepion pharaonis]|uniref:Uncharacterized protein n=1 Tax=Acanthosepion pharaonis TaxID=158019 RepID=A0A812CIL1_ACAPH|nr:unnamed protein product [Sepia pharaonis]